MKTLIVFLMLTCSSAYGQVLSGTVKEANRKLISDPEFIIHGMSNGFAKYELSVDQKGNVTGVRLTETNLKSTPARFETRNHVAKFKFEQGTLYPKFQHAIVMVTMLKSE